MNKKKQNLDHSKQQNVKNSSPSTSKLRLALDIGTNSIGWALYELNKYKKPCSIVSTGVRIFPSGRSPKDYSTLNASRRQARLQRRQRDRYIQRRNLLLSLLKKHGLFPESTSACKKLEALNPYELRAEGMKKRLDINHFGRALFHLNQRRGFKSNRKSATDKEYGVIAQSIKTSKELMEKSSSKTYGEFLWKRFQKMIENRKTPGSQQENWVLARKALDAGGKDNYTVYAKREMIEDEFNKLWDKQSKYHDKLKNKELKEIFKKAIFYQRQLKKPIVGTCELTGKKRIAKALPSFQKFRILKELNNLAYTNLGESKFVCSLDRGIEFRDHIIKILFNKNEVKFSQIEKEFKNFFVDIDNFSRFNLDTYSRKSLEGNKINAVLKKIIPDWINWDLDIQDRFIELLQGECKEEDFMKEDAEVLTDLQGFSKENKLNLSDAVLRECLKCLVKLPAGHGKYSKEAIEKILPFLEKGDLEYKAIESANLLYTDKKEKKLMRKLPLYQEILSTHCVEIRPRAKKIDPTQSQSPAEKYKNFRITNPTVHIAFNQLRLVVNDLIKIHGKPSQIVVETARDLPLGVKSKSELEKNQKQNKKRNDEARQVIDEFNQEKNKSNILRYKLWREQNETCVYSGRKISKSKLYSPELEVDHILPYSQTLDDSFMNKVLVYRSTNQNKGSSTPFEAFSHNKEKWRDILCRSGKLNKKKSWRFNANAMEKFQEQGDFLTRQLNDTRYISKYSKEYLESICKNVWVVRGQTTFLLRRVLSFEKSRDDHRNHTKDALIIGLVDRALVQHISNIAKTIEGQNKARLEDIGKAIKKEIKPWVSYKEDVKKAISKTIVSHRKRTKKEGRLHDETAYGFSPKVKDFSKPIDTYYYVDILNDHIVKANQKKLDEIISKKIREDFLKELQKNGSLSKEFLIKYHQETGIRRIRIMKRQRVLPPIKDREGKPYKAFKGGSNYAIKLFETKDKKWDAEIITTFAANQKDFKVLQGEGKLMKGDMLFFEKRYWVLRKFDQNKNIIFLEHFSSGNPNDIQKQEETRDQFRQKSPSSLQKLNPKRVHISPSGKMTVTPLKVK